MRAGSSGVRREIGLGSLPPFSVVVSIAYVVALLGTGGYFLLYFLLSG